MIEIDKRLGIIGHFGGGHDFLDGQTVKTKILYEELKKSGYDNIYCVDTYYNNTNKVKLMWDSIKCVFKCKTIIVLLSGKGMSVYFPMMYYAKKIFHRRVFHDVIGGNLTTYVDKYPEYKKYLSSFDENWVEFGKLKESLEMRGIMNCIVIPNFKRLNTELANLEIDTSSMRKFCMFSRVMKEKGMTDAIEAVSKFNDSHDKKFLLEIWGPIDDTYKDEFEELLKKYPSDVNYKGKVDYSQSVETLTNHLALLFPTYWKGEGFPGTIVDAYAAGLPVIASEWNANAELIDNFETGWVFPNEKIKDLDESLDWAYNNLDKMISMRLHCKDMANKYQPDMYMKIICRAIEVK